MRVPGLFASAGILLLVAQVVLSGVWSSLGGTRLPLAAAAFCFMVAIISGLVKGSAAVRLAILFLLLSLASLIYALLSFYGAELYIAASAAFAILAVTVGISGYLGRDRPTPERTASTARASE